MNDPNIDPRLVSDNAPAEVYVAGVIVLAFAAFIGWALWDAWP